MSTAWRADWGALKRTLRGQTRKNRRANKPGTKSMACITDSGTLQSTALRADFEALKGIASRADLDGLKSSGGQTEMLW
jgi:hypothetical protein